MVKIVEENTDGEQKLFPKEPIDKTLLLSSLREFQEDGVVMGVEKVLTPRHTFSKVKATVNVIFTVLGSFEQCRLYDLDENGQYITEYDQATGKDRNKVIIGDAQLKTVFFPFYVNCDEAEIDENTELTVVPATSSYPFFKKAYMNYGELPSDCKDVAFITTFKEMEEVLKGFEFRGKYGYSKTKNPFEFLDVELVE